VRGRPGSFLWLVQHDLRLGFLRLQSMFGNRRPVVIALVVVGVLVVFHLLAWPVAQWAFGSQAPASPDVAHPGLALSVLFLLPWLVSQALTQLTRALYTRGDLDLLLASPVSPRAVVSARALAVAVECLLSVGLFVFPMANVTAILGGPRWLAIYPTLAATALLATAIGLGITVALFALLGPRRTRMVSQVLATLIASVFILSTQIVNVLPAQTRLELIASFSDPQPGSLLHHEGPLWLPVRAALADPLALAGWLAVGIGAFGLAAIWLGPSFLASALRAAGVEAQPGRRRTGRLRRFRPGVGGTLRRKEWRLLLREPYLASQLLLQVIYTLPVSVVIWRSQGAGGSLAMAVVPSIVVIASQISASLAWLSVSSEDAPDFLATAPVSAAEVQRHKLESVILPMAVLILPPVIALGIYEPWAAPLALIFATAAASSTAILNFWHPMPGKRASVMRRHAQSKIVAVMEHALALLWALVAVLALLQSAVALLPLGLIAGILWINRPRKAKPTAITAIA
jgi:ABC-2 type transport system permease protein